MATPTMIAMRWSSMKRSTGARNENPSGTGSPDGFMTASNAGSNVMLEKYAIIIPMPAICPTSDAPPDRAGQPHARVVVAGKLQVARRLADRIGRLLAGLERGKIEHRLDIDEFAFLVRLRAAAHQLLPGEVHRLLGKDAFHRIGGRGQR